MAPPLETDAVVIGAGPAGLFQVFELGLLEIRAHVIDTLPVPGGQCIELYPDKPIYDIPGLPFCTGRELTDRLLQQIQPFGATFHLNQEVASVQRQAANDRSGVASAKPAGEARKPTSTVAVVDGQCVSLCCRSSCASDDGQP